MKDLIMAFATNARFDDFNRFVASVRRHCPPGRVDVSVFIDVLGDAFGRVAADHEVTLVPVENVWKWIRGSKLLNLKYHLDMIALRALARLAPRSQRASFREAYRHTVADWLHPLAGRWLAYRSYLRLHSAYRFVMTSDLRDVVFQGDPFDGMEAANEETLHVFEQTGVEFGNNLDTEWFQTVYGEEAVSHMRGKTTLCAGTVLGDRVSMLGFLDLMEVEVVRHPRTPLDQAMFNQVVYNQFAARKVVQHDLQSGPVLTLEGRHESLWEILNDKVVVGGRVVPVVHMYDRNPQTKDLFLAKYPVPSPDTRTRECRSIHFPIVL
jgi:hypothetical protein